MKPIHAARNWLHYLLLAIQAADATNVAQAFAQHHPLGIIGPDQQWSSWAAWATTLRQWLDPLQRGNLRFRFLAEIQLALLPGGEMQLRVPLRVLVTDAPPLSLDCTFMLLEEEPGRWVATSLRWSLLPEA